METTLVEILREVSETPALIWPVGAGFFGWMVWKFSPHRTRDPVKEMAAGFESVESMCARIEKNLEKIAAEQEAARAERNALANRATALETALKYLGKGGSP